ncbi:hypothetical protein BGW80DRAFT_1563622 [Lactifluus volemus]|nr:hypothetical protein BGW80DRAFT_1563622 [Lactifluus volemus]
MTQIPCDWLRRPRGVYPEYYFHGVTYLDWALHQSLSRMILSYVLSVFPFLPTWLTIDRTRNMWYIRQTTTPAECGTWIIMSIA